MCDCACFSYERPAAASFHDSMLVYWQTGFVTCCQTRSWYKRPVTGQFAKSSLWFVFVGISTILCPNVEKKGAWSAVNKQQREGSPILCRVDQVRFYYWYQRHNETTHLLYCKSFCYDSMRPIKLQEHLNKIHPEHREKPLKPFKYLKDKTSKAQEKSVPGFDVQS